MVETVMDVILDVDFSPAVLVETVLEISSLDGSSRARLS
jgi:hypothetical protein